MTLDELKKLYDEGTLRYDEKTRTIYKFDRSYREPFGLPIAHMVLPEVWQFIAAARTYLPKLIAVAEAAKAYQQASWPESPADVDYQIGCSHKLNVALAALEEP